MLDKSLIDRLHNSRVIDRNSVLWWQLGFEGRRVYTPKEFSGNLREIKYRSLTAETLANSNRMPGPEDYFEETLNVWVDYNVPILLNEITLGGMNIPVFTTVKPMSHSPEGWTNLRFAIESEFPASFSGMVYEQPHIRGIPIEVSEEFLFFYSFLLGERHGFYQSSVLRLNNEDAPIIPDPIHPSKFYKNLIEREWTGRRSQRKPKRFDLKFNGSEFVPYFEFNVNKPNVTIYPLPVYEPKLKRLADEMIQKNPTWDRHLTEQFLLRYHPEKVKRRLDLPIILSSSGDGKVKILGAGYGYGNQVDYWPLDEKRYKVTSQALKERLGFKI